MYKNLFCIQIQELQIVFVLFLEISKYRKHIFIMFVQINGGDVLYRIEETKLVCAISRKLVLG